MYLFEIIIMNYKFMAKTVKDLYYTTSAMLPSWLIFKICADQSRLVAERRGC